MRNKIIKSHIGGGVKPAHSNTFKDLRNKKYNTEGCKEPISLLPYSLINFKKAAFTLAEVLITLGIIGVVAAMTIPTLIQNYRIKALQTDLKKNYAMINQAILRVKADNDVFNLYTYCRQYSASQNLYLHKIACQEMIYNTLKINGTCSYKSKPQTYALNSEAYVDIGITYKPDQRLSNGSCIKVNVNAANTGITIDTNGSENGPNALGHDIFGFILDKNDVFQPIKTTKAYTEEELEAYVADKGYTESDMTKMSRTAGYHQLGRPCSRYDKRMGNGGGCSWFALNDICPDDPTKGYWECLPSK